MASIPFVEFDGARKLHLAACVRFAYEDMNIPSLTRPELQHVARAFSFNMERVRFLMLVPAHIGNLATMMQHLADVAEFGIVGTLAGEIPDDKEDAFQSKWLELFRAEIDKRSLRQSANVERALEREFRDGIATAEMMGTMRPTHIGLEALLTAHLTGTWTAFETMCGDLWEAALNAHPEGLAHLNGSPSRRKNVYAKDRSSDRPQQTQPKMVSLDLIASHGFSVQNRMGTILRERFAFNKLSGIREAYCRAFDKRSSRIDSALGDTSLDTLSAVRNLLVHQAGMPDQEYLNQQGRLKLPTALTPGLPIFLDGEIVVNMIEPVIGFGKNLLNAVEDWINHRSK